MARLRRFEHHRYVGTRDNMVVYDCDDPTDVADLERRMKEEDLMGQQLLQTFGPDDLAEARNRGFEPR